MPIDTKLLNLVANDLPKFNQDIISNVSTKQMLGVEEYIDSTFRCAQESFPKGLTYHGGRRCTPLETYHEITRPAAPKRQFPLQVSDTYLMKYSLRWKTEELRPIHIALPFTRPGGLIHLRDTQYRITPVLTGKVFNVEQSGIYMPTQRSKMGFSPQSHTVYMNNTTLLNGDIITSYLYNMEKKSRSTLAPTLLHYILAEYGLTVTLSKFFNINVKIGGKELDSYPLDEWVLFKSTQHKPINRRIDDSVSDIRIAIPLAEYDKLKHNGVICTVFYIVDNCASSTSNIRDLNNPQLWASLLFRFLFKATDVSMPKQYECITKHMHSTKQNMDPITRKMLAAGNIPCDTIFDLFAYVIVHYQDLQIRQDLGTMYYKDLTTVKYLLSNIVYNIFQIMWAIEKVPAHLLSKKRFDDIFMMQMRRDKILDVKGHGELTPVSIATDCMMYSATCNMISHNKATVSTRGSKHSKKTTTDVSLLLHPSQAEVSTYQWITHHGPEGRNKTNPFLTFSEKNYITPSNELMLDILEFKKLLSKQQ